jgi:threonine dehydrogenase-like Zn-dependent dehydrogenase
MHSGGMLGGWKFSNIKDGMFAEFFHVNEADANLAFVPEGMDLGVAAMLSDMLPTGMHGAELADVQFGDTVCVIGIGPVGLMTVRASVLRGAGRIMAVGTRPNCVAAAKEYGATDIISYKAGPILDQVMDLTGGKGVDRVIVAGGDCETFDEAVNMLKPGGIIGNVNYLGSGDYIKVPRLGWGVGMGHKTIAGGLMPGGRRRLEKLAALITNGRVDPSLLITHRRKGIDAIEEILFLMRDKPSDLIKPVTIIEW